MKNGNWRKSVSLPVILIAILIFSTSLSMGQKATETGAKWSFVVYSDNRGSNPTDRAVLTSFAKLKPDLILNLGDMLYRNKDFGTLDSFKKDVEECYGSFDSFARIYYPAVGGHDERYYNQKQFPPNGKEPDNEAGRKIYAAFDLKNRVADFDDQYGDYYFKHKGVNFIVLYRSDEWKFRDGQVTWLKNVLEKIDGKGPIVVAGHSGGWFYPAYKNQTEIVNLLKQYNVDIALAADWHDYHAETDGNLMRFRSGSAGWGDKLFLRFDVTDNAFIIRALQPDGVTPFVKRGLTGNIPSCWTKEFGKSGKELKEGS